MGLTKPDAETTPQRRWTVQDLLHFPGQFFNSKRLFEEIHP